MATHRCMHMNQTVFSNTQHERGALSEPTVLLDSLGIIPACAGSTPTASSLSTNKWDHPRMRGEHGGLACPSRHGTGSSPHARGAPHGRYDLVGVHGIIPACAGSTIVEDIPYSPGTDHPRMRGEHAMACSTSSRREGSSPHARGAQVLVLGDGAAVGIIPACAGSTRMGRMSAYCRWDHPRMRGEHAAGAWWEPQTKGSSPHARGARAGRGQLLIKGGIIPACAGSTRAQISGKPRKGDHPRMRGEHPLPGMGAGLFAGSSPHARGALKTAPAGK